MIRRGRRVSVNTVARLTAELGPAARNVRRRRSPTRPDKRPAAPDLVPLAAVLFARPEPREVFADLVEGLLPDLGRENGWTMAERAGHAAPHRIQKFLGEAYRNAGALLVEVQDYGAGQLGDAQATPVLDDAQVVEKGTRSGVDGRSVLRRGLCYPVVEITGLNFRGHGATRAPPRTT